MPAALEMQQVECLLLDIEGTTTPVDFVSKILFPYARVHFKEFLQQNWNNFEVVEDIKSLRLCYLRDASEILGLPEWKTDSTEPILDSVLSYVFWLMDRDRKSTPLKSLQGKIWHEGYISGDLRGEVYADVPTAFERWTRQGKELSIFSSGSVLAQWLLFSKSTAGDLTGFIMHYFDTAVGSKKELESYQRIAQSLEAAPENVLFVSDVVAELQAAQAAGMICIWCLREQALSAEAASFPIIRTFDSILP